MRKSLAVGLILLIMGCSAKRDEPRPAPPPPLPPLAHSVDWRGQTLEQIAGWYTGKSENWKKLTQPVNPDLERCCVPLRVGRQVIIPSELLITTEAMPKPSVKKTTAAKAKSEPRAAVASNAEPAPEPETAGVAAAEAPPEVAPEIVDEPRGPKSKAPASGKVDFHGESWSVADAIAYPVDDGVIAVALSSKPFDRKAFAKDGKIDSFDVLRHNGMASASSLTLKIDAQGDLGCVDFGSQNGGGSSCNSAISEGFKLDRRGDTVAGKLAFVSGEDKVDLEFAVPVTGKVERGGKPLPAGGGEAGAAVIANFKAIHAGDFEKAKALSHPDQRKMMEQNEEQAKEMFGVMKEITPSDVKVLGGLVDGDSAVLDFEGKVGDEPIKGTIDVQRFEGKWYLESVNTSQ